MDVNETEKSEDAKVLVIGLDGATFDLIRPWAEQGKLPTLKRLMDSGTRGELTSTILPFTAPSWTSFMTGKGPGKHGVFDFTSRGENGYESGFNISTSREAKSIWHILNQSGKRVGLINIPLTYPPEKVNGFMISGFPHPELKKDYTYPPDLVSLLEKEVGEYRVHMRVAFQKNKEAEFLQDIIEMTEKRAAATLHLMNKNEWDFFMVVFQSTDWIQHFFWKYMDVAHPEYDAKEGKKYGSAILEHFQRIDDIIKKILANVDDNTVVIIMSDHGFGPLHKIFYPNNWLAEIGLLKFKKNMKYFSFKLGITPENIYRILLKLGIARITKRVSKKRKAKIIRSFLSFSDVDWSKTKAYGAGHLGQIFINLKGREPEGIIEPGREYEEIRNLIIQKLKKLKNPETNELLVDEIFKKEEIYQGKYLNKAADIVYLMENYTTQDDLSFGSKKIMGRPPTLQSGCHRMNGLFLIKGDNVKKGKLLKKAGIIDVAPTILHLIGVPIPNDMDGKVLKEIFEDGFLEKNPIKYQEILDREGMVKSKNERTLSEKEEEKIKERLRDLGYMGQ